MSIYTPSFKKFWSRTCCQAKRTRRDDTKGCRVLSSDGCSCILSCYENVSQLISLGNLFTCCCKHSLTRFRLEDLGDSREKKLQQKKIDQMKGKPHNSVITSNSSWKHCHFGNRTLWETMFLLLLLQAYLVSMIKQPLVPKGFSGKFPTKSGKLVVPGFQGT
jgi:hypothetical protein